MAWSEGRALLYRGGGELGTKEEDENWLDSEIRSGETGKWKRKWRGNTDNIQRQAGSSQLELRVNRTAYLKATK